MTESILNRIKNEVWLTESEYMLWGVDPREWEIIERDCLMARIKIRRIDKTNDRDRTPSSMQ